MIRFHSAFQCPARFTAILFAAALVLATYAEAAVLTPVQAVFDKHLQSLYSVAVTPDGAHVYVADAKGGLFVFMRNDDGSLTPIETLRNGEGGVDGLAWAMSVTVSPDGAHVYVASVYMASGSREMATGAVAVFSRNATTGVLTFVQAQFDGPGGLSFASSMTVSSDGAHLYMAGQGGDAEAGAVAVFSRDATTGALTFVEAQFDGQGGVDGLDGAVSLTVSPDGAHLYIASIRDSAVTVFSRDATTGALTFVEAQFDGQGGVDGLTWASSVTVSPDGAHLYIASWGEETEGGAVAVFSRDATTGALTFVEAQFDGQGGVDGLAAAASVTVSPDAAHLYVVGRDDRAVAVFSRNATTGALTFVEAQFDGQDGVDGLAGANSVTVSPDGAHVYVASGLSGSGDNAVAVFSRDAATGALTFVEAQRDGAGGADGLVGAFGVTVSPDGAHIYVASFANSAVVVLARDATTGALTFVEAQLDGQGGVDGLFWARSVTVSPDGAHLYVASYGNAVAVFARNATTGALTFVEAQFDDVGGVDGLRFATSVALSPDGAHVYVTSGGTGFASESGDHAVAVFARDATTGALTFIEAQFDGVDGAEGLVGANFVTASPDGAHVYVASVGAAMPDGAVGALAVFSRDGTTGALTFIEAYFEGAGDAEGFPRPGPMALSPEGAHLYVATAGAVAVFSRDGTTGALTFVEADSDYGGSVDWPIAYSSVTVSPDGAYVYASGYGDDAIAVFSRDETTGAVTFVEIQFDGEGGVEGLDGASSVTVSPDGAHVYVASREDNAVQVFAVGAQGVGEGEGEGEGSEDSQGEGEGEGGPIGCAATGFQPFETQGALDDALVPILIGLLLLSAAGRRQRATHGKGGSPQE